MIETSQSYQYLVNRVLTLSEGMAVACLYVIGMIIVIQIITLIINLLVPGAEKDLRPLLHSLIFFFICTLYVDFARNLDQAAGSLTNLIANKDDYGAYVLDFKQRSAQMAAGIDHKLVDSPLAPSQNFSGTGTEFFPSPGSQLDSARQTLRNYSVIVNGQNKRIDNAQPSIGFGSSIINTVGTMLGFSANSFSWSIALLARTAASIFELVLTMFLLAIGPLALIFSSIPKFGNSFKTWLIAFFGVKLWKVAFVVIDLIHDAFMTIVDGVTNPGVQDYMIFTIANLCCAGLYIFAPTVLNLVWPSQGGTALSAITSGVTIFAQGITQSASAAGTAIAKKWS